MGCANNQIEYINYDVLNPPVNSNFKNTRLKREDFPDGEIYYLRDKKESKKEHLKKNAKHESEALDGVMAELSVEYKFSRPYEVCLFIGIYTFCFYLISLILSSNCPCKHTFCGLTDKKKILSISIILKCIMIK